MKKNSKSILLEKAENDFIAVQNLLKQDSSPVEIIAFHIQQMAEKLLKVVSIYYGVDYKPTHDLYLLLEQLESHNMRFGDFYDLAEKLSPHAVLTRYEEGYEIDLDDVKKLLEQASLLRIFIFEILSISK